MLKLSKRSKPPPTQVVRTLLSYMKDTSTYRQDTPRKLVGGQIAFGIGLRLHGKKTRRVSLDLDDDPLKVT